MGKAGKKLVKSKTKAARKVKKKRGVTKKAEPELAKATRDEAEKLARKPAEETPAKKAVPHHSTAEEMASRQREISVAEFFTKNRHLLGFANPHVLLHFVTPDGETKTYNRASQELPVETREIKPHPYGVELGVLIKMLHETKARTLQSFLHSEFSRISTQVARMICEKAKVFERSSPTRIARQEADNLFKAINQTSSKGAAHEQDCNAN